jgi:hypothetical protein
MNVLKNVIEIEATYWGWDKVSEDLTSVFTPSLN